MVKNRKLFLACALGVFSLTFAGCTQKEAEQEMAPEPAVEAPATEIPAAAEEEHSVPAEVEEEAAAETFETEEKQ